MDYIPPQPEDRLSTSQRVSQAARDLGSGTLDRAQRIKIGVYTFLDKKVRGLWDKIAAMRRSSEEQRLYEQKKPLLDKIYVELYAAAEKAFSRSVLTQSVYPDKKREFFLLLLARDTNQLRLASKADTGSEEAFEAFRMLRLGAIDVENQLEKLDKTYQRVIAQVVYEV